MALSGRRVAEFRGHRQPEATNGHATAGFTSGPRHRGRSLAALGARVSVVVPTLNEAANIPHVFNRMPEGLFDLAWKGTQIAQ